MAAGPSRMNDLTVIQASQGMAKYLLESFDDAKSAGIVIGYDGRHNSHRLAETLFYLLIDTIRLKKAHFYP